MEENLSNLILTCNAGSNNTKLCVFSAETLERCDRISVHTVDEAIAWIKDIKNISAIGHRIVHGGRLFFQPTDITDQVLNELRALIPLAPLHQPAALQLIDATRNALNNVRQIACFDTGFHHTAPEIHRRFALPRHYFDDGILRYGFHGLSYQHIVDVLPEHMGDRADGRIIIAHLGGGSSACAIKNRKSICSTMGFSTLDGLMMGTRCGALDAGVILHLSTEKKLSVPEVTDILYHQSGLKGVSGLSDNMVELLDSPSEPARQAIDLYCMMAARHIVGLIPALGGLDALVFTGGIGEHSQTIRDKITHLMTWVGQFALYIIPTDEELVIAQACQKMSRDPA